MEVGDKNSAVVRIEKVYNGVSYYSGNWFEPLTFQIDIETENVEHAESSPQLKRIDKPKSKGNWENGPDTKVIDLVQIDEHYIITGYLTNPTSAWATTTLNGTITSAATSIVLTSAASFPSEGMIIIENEYIYYTGKSTNTLTGCQRGFFDTVASAHTTGVAIENRTDGAICKLAKLSWIKQHGGSVQVYMRNRKIECIQTKFKVDDTKKENDGLSQEVTEYFITLDVFRGSIQ